MLERGKMDRGVIEIVDTESLVPKDHLLRKIDAAVDFNRLYDMQRMQIIKVPQLKLRRKFSCSFSKCYLLNTFSLCFNYETRRKQNLKKDACEA